MLKSMKDAAYYTERLARARAILLMARQRHFRPYVGVVYYFLREAVLCKRALRFKVANAKEG